MNEMQLYLTLTLNNEMTKEYQVLPTHKYIYPPPLLSSPPPLPPPHFLSLLLKLQVAIQDIKKAPPPPPQPDPTQSSSQSTSAPRLS